MTDSYARAQSNFNAIGRSLVQQGKLVKAESQRHLVGQIARLANGSACSFIQS